MHAVRLPPALLAAVLSLSPLVASCGGDSTAPIVTLAFITQPTATMAGHTIPPVQVQIRDADGAILPGATDSVTIAIGTNPSSGTLGGTTTVRAIGGVATFVTLSIDNPGAGYTLTATAGGQPGTASAAFTVTGFASVSSGGIHTCALTTGGAAYCWGDNRSGQLGNGSTTSSTTPVPVSGGHTFALISAGSDSAHTCGLTTAGAIYCWGQNNYGQLGNTTPAVSTTPLAVTGGLTFAAVTTGWQHTCGVTAAGAAWCWGSNGGGELGNGTPNGGATPTAVAGGLTFARLSAGNFLTCGATSAGPGYCWGVAGRLGSGVRTNSPVPVAVAGGLSFATVSAASHTCATTTSGAAYCWGWDADGQLGDGPYDPMVLGYERLAPVSVLGGLTFTGLTTGYWFTCGVTAAGEAWCWGANDAGQLGNGSTTGPELCYITPCSHTPVAVAGKHSFSAVSSGNFHTCGLTPSGSIYCWGDNNRGQLGNGSTTSSSTPVRVRNP